MYADDVQLKYGCNVDNMNLCVARINESLTGLVPTDFVLIQQNQKGFLSWGLAEL